MPALGTVVALGESIGVEIAASCGFDYVIVDLQHGVHDFQSAKNFVQIATLAGCAAMVRVPWGDLGIAGRLMDVGASGIIFPMIETPEDLREAIRRVHYAPVGQRSSGVIRRPPETLSPGKGWPTCIALVESEAAIGNIANIVDTDGLDAVYLGPSDLCASFGLEKDTTESNAALREIYLEVLGVCAKRSLPVGTHCSTAAEAGMLVDLGFDLISISTDLEILTSGFRTVHAAARGALPIGARQRPARDTDFLR